MHLYKRHGERGYLLCRRRLHDRMPVLLPTPEAREAWLAPEQDFDPGAVKGLSTPYNGSDLTWHEVDPAMGSPKVQGPACCKPIKRESIASFFKPRSTPVKKEGGRASTKQVDSHADRHQSVKEEVKEEAKDDAGGPCEEASTPELTPEQDLTPKEEVADQKLNPDENVKAEGESPIKMSSSVRDEAPAPVEAHQRKKRQGGTLSESATKKSKSSSEKALTKAAAASGQRTLASFVKQS